MNATKAARNCAAALLLATPGWMLGGCDGDAATSLPMQPVGDLHDTMTWVIDPAADVIWGSAGAILTADGVEDLAPTTDEGWAQVRHSAAVLAESGNLLLMPHLLPKGEDAPSAEAWIEFSHGMTRIAQRAMQAVDDQDAEALFETGGHLYNVCLACHQVYARGES